MRLLSWQSKTLIGASGLLAFFQLLSRLVGLVRDRVLASSLGASNVLDVYYVSFNIPDFVFNLLVAGAISAAFIPVFIEKKEKSEKEARQLANNFFNLTLIAVIILAAVIFIFVPGLINIIAPGFGSAKKEMAVIFTKVMLLGPIIFGASMVIGSVLQVEKRFIAYALAPIFYNIGIIIGALYFVPWFGPLGLAEGVVLGAILHLGIQLLAICSLGYKWQAVFDVGDRAIRKIFLLVIPRALGLAVAQINLIILNALATTMFIGGVAMFNLANNLQYLPVALVGISVAVASFPDMSREALKKDKKEFSDRISRTLRGILFIVVPVSSLMLYFAPEIVAIILGAGLFNYTDVIMTANILAFFSVGIFGHSLIPTLARAFYSMQNTKIPVIASIISIATSLISVFFLSSTMGIFALPVAFSLMGIINTFILMAILDFKLPEFSFGRNISYLLGVSILSLLMLVVVVLADRFLTFSQGLTMKVLRLLVLGSMGIAFYVLLAYILRIKELNILKR